MKNRFLKTASLAVFSILGFGALVLSPTAAANNICDQCGNPNGPPDDVCAAYGCAGYENSNDLQGTIIGILNGIIGGLGIIAVIFIIIGGINYVTSTGDSGKVKKAKDTILYALIGLVICALSYAIVNWVIMNAIPQN